MPSLRTFPPLLGGSLLIAGSCIGAGMLGLPVITGPAGFLPALCMFLLAWLFMWLTGVLLLEVNLWFKKDISLATMVTDTFGFKGKVAVWFLTVFLYSALLAAFITQSGSLVLNMFPLAISKQVASLVFTVVFGAFVYFGTGAVDRINRVLMVGLIISYFLLLFMGMPEVDLENFTHVQWKASPFVLPAMITSFGYHNLIPSLCTYYKRDGSLLRKSFLIGTLFTLCVYFLWEALILGIIPLEGEYGLEQAFAQGFSSTDVLVQAVNAPWLVTVVVYFAFFSVVTTFLGISLGFIDFLADGLHVQKTKLNRFLLCLAVLVPPYIIGVFYPHIFLQALSFAGMSAVGLFGMLPIMMVWKGRKEHTSEYSLPGGRGTLALIFLTGCFIMGVQFYQLFNT